MPGGRAGRPLPSLAGPDRAGLPPSPSPPPPPSPGPGKSHRRHHRAGGTAAVPGLSSKQRSSIFVPPPGGALGPVHLVFQMFPCCFFLAHLLPQTLPRGQLASSARKLESREARRVVLPGAASAGSWPECAVLRPRFGPAESETSSPADFSTASPGDSMHTQACEPRSLAAGCPRAGLSSVLVWLGPQARGLSSP